MKRFLLMVTMACILTSCSPSNVDTNGDLIPTPIILKSETDNGRYTYIIDKNTGAVYLEYDGYRRRALTVMLNTDGTPLTAEQLGIKY
jgi:hypothetical protein